MADEVFFLFSFSKKSRHNHDKIEKIKSKLIIHNPSLSSIQQRTKYTKRNQKTKKIKQRSQKINQN